MTRYPRRKPNLRKLERIESRLFLILSEEKGGLTIGEWRQVKQVRDILQALRFKAVENG